MMAPLLAVRGLTKEYGSRVACVDVDLEVRPGEVLGIVGESGSGKSTVLRCLYLDVVPDAGSVRLAGEELTRVDAKRRRWLRSFAIGMVYQAMMYQGTACGLDLRISAGGNVAERLLAADWRHVGKIRSHAGDLLARVEIAGDRIDDRTDTFSGGMRQRLQLAKAMANEPPLLLLDEPTSSLDVHVQAAILDLVKELQAQTGVAMVVVSHDLGVIRLLAHRTMVMYRGRVVESGITEQVLEDPQDPYTQLLVSSSLG
jgi:putative phosphonate transport system ATP-binding protein